LQDSTKRRFAIGRSHGLKTFPGFGAEVGQVAIVRKYPLAAPEFTLERMAILERHDALRCPANVGNHVAAFDRIVSDEIGNGRMAGRRRIQEHAEPFALKEPNPPAVAVLIGSPSAGAKSLEGKADIGGDVGVHAEQLAHRAGL